MSRDFLHQVFSWTIFPPSSKNLISAILIFFCKIFNDIQIQGWWPMSLKPAINWILILLKTAVFCPKLDIWIQGVVEKLSAGIVDAGDQHCQQYQIEHTWSRTIMQKLICSKKSPCTLPPINIWIWKKFLCLKMSPFSNAGIVDCVGHMYSRIFEKTATGAAGLIRGPGEDD